MASNPHGGPHGGPQRRAAQRVSCKDHLVLPDFASFVAGRMEGSGQIPNISVGGALVADVSLSLEVGTEFDMYFHLPGSEHKLHAIGRVVRQAESGFATIFLWLESALRQVVSHAVEEEIESKAQRSRA